MIQLIAGLGNPGTEYADTRHNAGFWFVDALARQLGASLRLEKGYQGQMCRVQTLGQTLWLLEPQTFMNLSGHSVAALAGFYKIPAERILVVHDELDLPPGEAKLKLGGGHAGHNGLRSIHAQLGTDQYWRLRLGIGHPGDRAEVIHWVLKKPLAEQREAIDTCMARCQKALPDLLAGDMAAATRHIHTSKPPRPKPPRQPAAAAAAANPPESQP
jgi:PTH1 family peptidyl-tRNA hydrolase